jgi:hypothetical protein
MPQSRPSTNGACAPPIPDQEFLPFPDAERCSYRRLSVNAAWTVRRATGQHDVARTLLDDLLTELQQRRAPTMPDLDAVDARLILPNVEQRLQGIPERSDIAVGEMRDRLGFLRDLASRRPTKIVRLTREIVATAVSDAIAPLRAALVAQLHEAPFTCIEVIAAVQHALRDLSFPVPDFSSQKRLMAGVRALETIERATTISPKVRDVLLTALRKRCETEFQSALSAIELDYLCESLRQAIAELHPLLDELRSAQGTFRRNVEAIRQQLEEQRIAARQRGTYGRSGVLLELESPEHDQLLAGVRDRHHCEDRAALTALFTDRLQQRWNDTAQRRYPFIQTPATLVDLLTKMPARAAAHGVLDIVAEMIGDIHTVYTAVQTLGVRHVAQELFERSDPLTHLTSRDHVALNVETHRDVLVRLPLPRGADDAQIAEELREGFRELHQTVQFVDDAVDAEITVVRTLVGFPIAIEGGNEGLLIDYAAAARQGHRPHLFGILPNAPDGQAIPELLALAHHRNH